MSECEFDKITLYLKMVNMTPYMTSHAHRDDIGCIITLIYKTSVIDYDPEKLKFLFDNYSVTFLKVEGLEIYSINKFQ